MNRLFKTEIHFYNYYNITLHIINISFSNDRQLEIRN